MRKWYKRVDNILNQAPPGNKEIYKFDLLNVYNIMNQYSENAVIRHIFFLRLAQYVSYE